MPRTKATKNVSRKGKRKVAAATKIETLYEELETEYCKQFSIYRQLLSRGEKQDALVIAHAIEALRQESNSDALDRQVAERQKIIEELNKERFDVYKTIQSLYHEIETIESQPLWGAAAQDQTIQDQIDFASCNPQPISVLSLMNYQIQTHQFDDSDNIRILFPPTPPSLAVSPNNSNALFSTSPLVPSPMRFFIDGGRFGSASGHIAWGFTANNVGCGIEIHSKIHATGLANVIPNNIWASKVDVKLETNIGQYRTAVANATLPYWGSLDEAGFFGALRRPTTYRSWRSFPPPSIENGNPATSSNNTIGLNPIEPHEAALWLRLTDVQPGDFFIIQYRFSVNTTSSIVDFSYQGEGSLVINSPVIIVYDN